MTTSGEGRNMALLWVISRWWPYWEVKSRVHISGRVWYAVFFGGELFQLISHRGRRGLGRTLFRPFDGWRISCCSHAEVKKSLELKSRLASSHHWDDLKLEGTKEEPVPLEKEAQKEASHWLFFFFLFRSIHLKCYSSYKCWGLMCEAFVQDENCRLRCYAGIFSCSEALKGGGEPTVAGCFSTAVISPWKRCCYIPYIIFKIHALHTKIRTTSNSKTAN